MPRPGGTGLDVEGRVGEASAAWAQRDAARDVAAEDGDDLGLPAVRLTSEQNRGVDSARTSTWELSPSHAPAPAQLDVAVKFSRACQNGAQRLYHIRQLGAAALEAGTAHAPSAGKCSNATPPPACHALSSVLPAA
jgi:hypothetical protein